MYVEEKLHYALEKHVDYWMETGASEFVISVIRNGYVLSFYKYLLSKGENNRLYLEEQEWANEAVWKLAKARLVKEVSQEELVCVNPLYLVKNAVGKRRLCLDLSLGKM